MLLVILLIRFITEGFALYSSSADVITLNPSNFQKLVINTDDVWIVEFFAPWCGHCQQLAPEYQKAATALKGLVKVGAIDVDEHKHFGGLYGIKGFPTIKIFDDKKQPNDYNGARTAQGLVDGVLSAIRNRVYAKLSGKTSGQRGGSGDVIELTDANFDNVVLDSEDMWLVEFFAPWCGHCKNLAPHWAEAATTLKGKVKLGALDATVHVKKASQFRIESYPTIKYFAPGKKQHIAAVNYDGARTANDIVNWALEQLMENAPIPEVMQIIDDKIFKTSCEEKNLCVISVLPQLLDCQSKCRNEYLDLLRRIAEKYKSRRWGWVWMEALSQPSLEDALEMGGFGYPAMAVFNARKLMYSALRGSFSDAGINEFLRDLSYGRGSSVTIRGGQLPDILNIAAWDGKDEELPQEEDIDLSDVVLDEKDEL